jgi:hypothetical protein
MIDATARVGKKPLLVAPASAQPILPRPWFPGTRGEESTGQSVNNHPLSKGLAKPLGSLPKEATAGGAGGSALCDFCLTQMAVAVLLRCWRMITRSTAWIDVSSATSWARRSGSASGGAERSFSWMTLSTFPQ